MYEKVQHIQKKRQKNYGTTMEQHRENQKTAKTVYH